jgi:ATP adenylyltransferase
MTMKQLWAPWRMAYLRGEHKPMKGCLFCEKIKLSDSVEHILYRGKSCYVTLNRFPYNNGHLLIVPYTHTGLVETLDDATSLELMQLVQHSIRFLREAYNPEGFNIGINEGSAAGAGIAEHVHLHIVPRWSGDANYITVVGATRVVPESLEETYATFRPMFDTLKCE